MIFKQFVNYSNADCRYHHPEVQNVFVSTMDGILEEIYDILGMYTLVAIVSISLVIHILSLKK